ncbi:Imm30 family immunity protein [Metabacillus fastidiosus]|uniref:Imm30 family immunity protein n=1 Tax=Metabacillus fastidiosus TaxID=1458 RepID=UPI003D2C62BF
MSHKDQITILNKMRFLENEEDDIEEIEHILNELLMSGSKETISALCHVLHDDIEVYITGDIIETIFYIVERVGLENGLYELVKGISKMSPDADWCAKRIHKTIMNSESLIPSYIEVLKKEEPSVKQALIALLREISEEQPDLFSQNVNKILEQVK